MRLIIPVIFVALALALAAIVWLLEVEHEQTGEISKLKAELADKSGRQDLDLKRQCEAEAERFFKLCPDFR